MRKAVKPCGTQWNRESWENWQAGVQWSSWVRLNQTIITGVSFRKILGFYYKGNRLQYHKRTSSNILLKIPKSVNRVIFQNSSELLLLKILQHTKTCSKSTTKKAPALLQECCLGVFNISSDNIFEVYDEIWFY